MKAVGCVGPGAQSIPRETMCCSYVDKKPKARLVAMAGRVGEAALRPTVTEHLLKRWG